MKNFMPTFDDLNRAGKKSFEEVNYKNFLIKR